MKNIGYLKQSNSQKTFNSSDFDTLIRHIRKPIHMIYEPSQKMLGLAIDGEVSSSPQHATPLIASLPAIYPEWLGDRNFLETHNLRFAYVGGAMARGITSSKMVIELAKIGMLGFLGSAGMNLERLEKEIILLSETLNNKKLSFGINLIHTPNDPSLENKIVELCLKYGVKRISTAAFTQITPAIIHFLAKGLSKDSNGNIIRKHFIFAKISHPEVAKSFLSPAPNVIVEKLVLDNKITHEEAELIKRVPVSEDIDVEADSGGHTDNRPMAPLFSAIVSLRNELSQKFNYRKNIRIGIGGGIGTPQAVAAAFALGASHILVGSVHQSSVEAGTSKEVKMMLAKASIADVMMTASADMFEMGVKVQVLKKGTMMGIKGNRLYEIYKKYNGIEDIPQDIRLDLEKNIFRMPLEKVWEETKAYFTNIEPDKFH